MTAMRKVLFMFLVLGALCVWSCQKEVEPTDTASGFGNIELRLDSGKAISLQTKATNLEEGLEFNNVLVILVNNSGNVVRNVYKTYPYVPGVEDIQDAEGATSVTEDVIHFNQLLPGSYHVYAYANIDAATWQKTGSDLISSQEQSVSSGTSFSAFLDRELASLTGTAVPADPSTSMLLTGHKEIAVGLTTVSETLDLLRPVVRFKVTIRNHTPYPVQVDELRFSQFNADKAYLLDHRNASGIPSVPGSVSYRSMPDFDPSGEDDNSVAANADEVVYQRLLYENASPDTYKVFATLTLDRSSRGMGNLELSLGDRPFGVIDYETLSEMADGEQVDVLVTNPQISVRSGRIFCYISSENNMVWESAGYEDYNGFYSRAKAIWDENNDYDYSSRYSYSTANGYSGWDGLAASAGSQATQATHFNYTGAKSRYFHTLSKSNGVFSLSGLALQEGNKNDNGKCLTAITDLHIEKGAPYKKGSDWKNPSTLTNELVRFRLSSNNYIQADALWSANNPDIKTNLKLFSGSQTTGDRQFMLFGKYKSGGLLKRILKDNNKEVPLTYMARNEEINVIINVYYSDQTGEINFQVDNSTWSTATTSSHTFN